MKAGRPRKTARLPLQVNPYPILRAMVDRDMTRQDLAEEAGLAPNTITRALRHLTASLPTYAQICAVMKVPLTEVVSLDTTPI